jgi:RNA ligase
VKIWQYLGVTPEAFRTKYLETGLVDVATHDEFPLQMLTYGREAVYGNVWDDVTRKCRGIIFNIETDEIVARPFEKFFNLSTAGMPETDPATWSTWTNALAGEPEVWEKMDGFLCTMYQYNGESYIASKGSFNSTHAKWATAWYRAHVGVAEGEAIWPKGYTPVFEGICSSLRIVVGYEFEGLVLLALVNNETGEELGEYTTYVHATKNGVTVPQFFQMSWQEARTNSMDSEVKNVEGYVLVWRRAGQTPFRLKVKYVDYLRLHRMVSGVSAKAIYNCLAGNEYKGDLDEWTNESTPWFSKFVTKWVRALTAKHDEIEKRANIVFDNVKQQALDASVEGTLWTRKRWADCFIDGNKDIAGVLFAILDGKDEQQVIWKLVKPMTKNAGPCCNASLLR